MNLFKKKKVINKKSQTMPEKSFEQREKLYSLSALTTIVNRGQSQFYIDAYQKQGASMTMVLYGYSNPPDEYRNILGVDTKKEILLTFAREEQMQSMLKIASDRFKISQAAKGIAFVIPLTSISGIAPYKFLSDFNKQIRESEDGKRKK